jgi:CTP:molybdopterin cytidylyltransferase MocA
VKAGSKAFHILAPRTRKFTEESEDGEETERVVMTGFAPCAVFRYEDTEGDALPAPADYTPDELPPLYGVAEAFGIDVQYHAASDRPGWLGRYQRRGASERIHLVTEDEATYLHELAHAAHARVLTGKGAKLQGGQDAKQEAVAELSATVLAGLYGTDYSGNCWQYVKSYAKNCDVLRLMVSVITDVCEVCALILDTDAGLPTPPPGTGIAIAPTAPYGEPSASAASAIPAMHTDAATVTMRAGDMPDLATADSYTLQTVDGSVSVVMRHGQARWSVPIPNASSSTREAVAVKMTGRQLSVLRDILAVYPVQRRVAFALDCETAGLLVTVGHGSVGIGARRVDALTALPLPGTLPTAVGHGATA